LLKLLEKLRGAAYYEGQPLVSVRYCWTRTALSSAIWLRWRYQSRNSRNIWICWDGI